MKRRALLVIYLLLTTVAPLVVAQGEGVTVAVTFSNIAEDVKLLACNEVNVISIAPPGIDPHTYQLRPSDVDVLKGARLIISTGHTPFENKIEELVKSGEIRGELMDILEIPGLRLSLIPGTNAPNYHLPISDPRNYVLFINAVAAKLAEIDPQNAACYYARASNITVEVIKLMNSARGEELRAVLKSPSLQYLVEWAGVKAVYILKVEEEAEVPAGHLQEIERAVKDSEIDVIVVPEGDTSKEAAYLINLASQYGVPLLQVPSVLEKANMLSKYARILAAIEGLEIPEKGQATSESGNLPWALMAALAIAAALAGAIAFVKLRARSI